MKQYKKSVEDSNLIISELSGVIETKQTDVNQTLKKVETARSLNIKEEEKNRYLNKQSAALECAQVAVRPSESTPPRVGLQSRQ